MFFGSFCPEYGLDCLDLGPIRIGGADARLCLPFSRHSRDAVFMPRHVAINFQVISTVVKLCRQIHPRVAEWLQRVAKDHRQKKALIAGSIQNISSCLKKGARRREKQVAKLLRGPNLRRMSAIGKTGQKGDVGFR